MTVLVTGGTGFLGRHLVRQLLARGERVRVLARRPQGMRSLTQADVEVLPGDVIDPRAVAAAVDGCHTVYHLAATYSTRREHVPRLYQVNVQGTLHVLLAARAAGVRRIVHTSTIGTIGRPSDGSSPDETVPFNQWDGSHYVRSKYFGELVAQAMGRMGASVVIVHPTACVGPEDVGPSATGRRLLAFLQGRWVPYPPGGVNFVPVIDVAQGMVMAAERGQPGRRYILGHAQGNLDERAYLALMTRVSGQEPPTPPWRARWARWLRRSGRWGYLPEALTADPARAVQELGMPQSDLSEAFREAVRWFRENGYTRGQG